MFPALVYLRLDRASTPLEMTMPWFWTDDLARALVEAGMADRSEVDDWVARPTALVGPEGLDSLQVACRILGIDADDAAGAA